MMDLIDGTLLRIQESPVVVCLRLNDLESAQAAARAVLEGGLSVLEVTLTTPGALDLIAELATDDRALVGAGTVMSVEQAEAVAQAGARFALSPVFDEEVLQAATAAGVLFVPGAATPTEIDRASRGGAPVVKVFPIGPLGGVSFIQAVRGPLPGIRLLPTNGIGFENARAYFEAGVFAIGVGREVIDPEWVARGDYDSIRAAAARWKSLLE